MKKNALFLFFITIVSFIILKDLPAKDSGTNIPYEKPGSLQLFNPVYHFPPVNQDTTNACWSFSTLSFIESELYRINGSSVKLSVMFPVYYAFIEKGKYFVKTRGKSRFKAGDLFPTVLCLLDYLCFY